MEKKRVGKIVILTLIAVLAVALMCVCLAGCGSNVLTVKENGTYSTFGHDRVSVEVPTESSTYNVSINTVESTETNKSRVEVIEDIRPTVVDVYGRAANGTSAGSGVIIGSSGNEYFIVTNQHVTGGCTNFSVDVLFIDEETDEETYQSYDADFIGGSPKRDIAVLKIEKKSDEELKTANIISDSNTVKVGTDVIAIGNPLGILGGTVTMGIVSATAREVSVEDIGTMTLMQTDAAINNGNSGGGLFDTNGNLVGVVNSGYSSYEGLNFAIPANDAVYAAQSLLDTYKVTENGPSYGYIEGDTDLGLTFQLYNNVNASATDSTKGSYVFAVTNSYSSPFYTEWSNSYKAVFAIEITNDSGKNESASVTSVSDVTNIMKEVKAGDTVKITYKSVKYSGFGLNMKYFLDDAEQTASVTATQYIYSI